MYNTIIIFLLTIFFSISTSYCDNSTKIYLKLDDNSPFQTRQSRLLSFNTKDKDIDIELSFSIPFITIPIKPTMDMAQGTLANLNVGALIFGGVLIFGATFLIPGILYLLTKPKFSSNTSNGYRMPQTEFWNYLSILDQTLLENNIDTVSCMQKLVCSIVRKSSRSMEKGYASNQDKLLDMFINSEWIRKILDGTAIEIAMKKGRNKENCAKEYENCKINQKDFQNFTTKITSLFTNES